MDSSSYDVPLVFFNCESKNPNLVRVVIAFWVRYDCDPNSMGIIPLYSCNVDVLCSWSFHGEL